MTLNLIEQIEGFTTIFLNKFTELSNKCKNDQEYLALITSTLVFNDLVMNHFISSMYLEEDSVNKENEVELSVQELLKTAKEISDKIIYRVNQINSN